MSATVKFGTPEFWQRVIEFIERMTPGRLALMSPGEVEALAEEYRSFLSDANIPAPPPGWELEVFATELAIRQGTILPDFESLYRRKEELDQRLLGEPPESAL